MFAAAQVLVGSEPGTKSGPEIRSTHCATLEEPYRAVDAGVARTTDDQPERLDIP
jgi:hypothetical protein